MEPGDVAEDCVEGFPVGVLESVRVVDKGDGESAKGVGESAGGLADLRPTDNQN